MLPMGRNQSMVSNISARGVKMGRCVFAWGSNKEGELSLRNDKGQTSTNIMKPSAVAGL
jgi:alpha-tubulin suppressor-like RCC1 family protein